ncbi:hypothetical protein KP509_13G012700 [Ceratopteris richardii]|uniref:CCHC-type domain-containing protein n=1 Tax=Ceratopteris richardii TaxID=49495 RepID=A0A8T2TDF7_CERRI|nr:hypothetical protein KP509_13G012700 [Ceratopteris richardii]
MISSSTRLIIHLTKGGGEASPCTGIPDDIFEDCKKKISSLKNSQSILQKGSARGLNSGPLSFLKERQRNAEIEIARTVIECNLSFNILRTERWKRMVKAIASVGPCEGWTGVTYNDMRTKKLDEEIARINKSLEPIRDGWVKGIINILVSCPLGTYFLRAVDAGTRGKKVTGAFIYRHIKAVIEEVGPNNIIQVITDNASNCKSMARKLEEDFPSIVWTPCASHCLDLLMEDIGSLSWVKSILTQALSIVTFINTKVRVLTIYRTYSDLELLKPSSTRFAYMWIVLERLVDVQNKIQKTMVSDEFKEWLEAENSESKQEAKTIQRLTLKEEFWAAIKGVVVATLPIYKVLRMTDMEGSTMGLLYHFMEDAFKEIEKSTILDGVPDGTRDVLEDTPKKDDILFLFKKRWDSMKRPIHHVDALLHPAYKRAELFANQELKEQMFHFLPKIVSEEHHGDFLQQLINYGDQRGSAFSSSICWKRESLVKPLFWWESFGFQLAYLQKVALRILRQDCSSGACERNWSAYSLIHTKIRNKLSTKQLERLIYCRSNLRMLRCMAPFDDKLKAIFLLMTLHDSWEILIVSSSNNPNLTFDGVRGSILNEEIRSKEGGEGDSSATMVRGKTDKRSNNAQRNKSKRRERGNNRKGKSNDVTCYQCGTKGHKKHDCRYYKARFERKKNAGDKKKEKKEDKIDAQGSQKDKEKANVASNVVIEEFSDVEDILCTTL